MSYKVLWGIPLSPLRSLLGSFGGPIGPLGSGLPTPHTEAAAVAVAAQMQAQFALGAEAEAALRAGEGPAAAVQPAVRGEAGLVAEGFVALRAGVGPLTRVHALVQQQIPAAAERPAALLAFVAALGRVAAQVQLQALLPGEAALAAPAGEGPLLAVLRAVPDEAELGLQAPPALGGQPWRCGLLPFAVRPRVALVAVPQQVALQAEAVAAFAAGVPLRAPLLLVCQEVAVVPEHFAARRALVAGRRVPVLCPVCTQRRRVLEALPADPADLRPRSPRRTPPAPGRAQRGAPRLRWHTVALDGVPRCAVIPGGCRERRRWVRATSP